MIRTLAAEEKVLAAPTIGENRKQEPAVREEPTYPFTGVEAMAGAKAQKRCWKRYKKVMTKVTELLR